MHEGAFVFLCFEWLTLVDREQKSNRVGIVKRFDEKITLNPVVKQLSPLSYRPMASYSHGLCCADCPNPG